MFINKLKTKFNSFFLQNGFKYEKNSHNSLWRNSPQDLNNYSPQCRWLGVSGYYLAAMWLGKWVPLRRIIVIFDLVPSDDILSLSICS